MEEFESLSEDEQSELEERFNELERRVDQLEHGNREGYTALKNQNRLVHYLGEIARRVEEHLGIELPGVPSLEDPSEAE